MKNTGTRSFAAHSISFLLAVAVVTTLLIFPASAVGYTPEEYNQLVYDHAHEIHQTYGIGVRYPIREDGYAAIGTGTLNTLDQALGLITPSVISQLSQYYYDTRGSYLTIRFTYLPSTLEHMDVNALARFTESTSTIELFLPSASNPMIMSGSSPIAITHEIGHAFYQFFSEKHGEQRFYREWKELQGSYPYSSRYNKNPDHYTFASHYATYDGEEDFAETFAYAFCGTRPGLGLAPYLYTENYTYTPLGKKVDYVKRILPYYLSNTFQARHHIQTSQKTSAVLEYDGLELSGNSLEYVGYDPPHGVFSTILSTLKIQEKKSHWVEDIGGWEVEDTKGGRYFIFPGATFVTLRIPN